MKIFRTLIAVAATAAAMSAPAQGFDPTVTDYYRDGEDAVFFTNRPCMISDPSLRGTYHAYSRIKNFVAYGCYLITDRANMVMYWDSGQTQQLNAMRLRPIAQYKRHPLPSLDASVDYPRPRSLIPGSGKGFVLRDALTREEFAKGGLVP